MPILTAGISLDLHQVQMAVGANENIAVVWDISTKTRPTEKCRLPHRSAVKGIAFCPWAPSLLATGGGSNDRHVRFWHTGSGTLLREADTGRQISALFWSTSKKELLLLFGFRTGPDPVVAAIYLYPHMHVVALALAPDSLRALSGSVAPNQSKVALAANDGTVRVYGLWDGAAKREMPGPLPAALPLSSGTYGSAIVENVEGVGEHPRWR